MGSIPIKLPLELIYNADFSLLTCYVSRILIGSSFSFHQFNRYACTRTDKRTTLCRLSASQTTSITQLDDDVTGPTQNVISDNSDSFRSTYMTLTELKLITFQLGH